MRLPFVQVDQRYIVAQSRVIASLAAISHAEALGLGVSLFTFGLEATWTDKAPPDGVFVGENSEAILEDAIGWKGEKGRGIEAFIRAGVVERLEGGLRIRGMDRYHEAWTKQHKRTGGLRRHQSDPAKAKTRTEHARKAALGRWNNESVEPKTADAQFHAQLHAQSMLNHAQSDAQLHAQNAPKTQKQTQTHKKHTPPPSAGAVVEITASLANETVSVDKDAATDACVDIWRKLETARFEHFGVGPPRDVPPETARSDLVRFSEAHEKNTTWALQTQRNWFLRDPRYTGGLNPPGKTGVFLRASQWPDYQEPQQKPRELQIEREWTAEEIAEWDEIEHTRNGGGWGCRCSACKAGRQLRSEA